MEYSSNFIDSLTRQFYTIGSHSIDTSLSPNIINFTKNNIFDKMLVIDISGDEVIIPIIAVFIIDKRIDICRELLIFHINNGIACPLS